MGYCSPRDRQPETVAAPRLHLLKQEPALARHLTALTADWIDELSEVVAQRLGSHRQAHVDARLVVGALIGALNAAGELWFASGLRGHPRALMNRATDIVEYGLAGTVEKASLRENREQG